MSQEINVKFAIFRRLSISFQSAPKFRLYMSIQVQPVRNRQDHIISHAKNQIKSHHGRVKLILTCTRCLISLQAELNLIICMSVPNSAISQSSVSISHGTNQTDSYHCRLKLILACKEAK